MVAAHSVSTAQEIVPNQIGKEVNEYFYFKLVG